MNFQISALDPQQFKHLFGKDESILAHHGVERYEVDDAAAFPCRVSLQDAPLGASMLLLNYEHQPAQSPYRSSHAIFIREWADQARPAPNEVPESIRIRLLSVRSFDDHGTMLDADVVEGKEIEPLIGRLLADDRASYLHIHNARRGCYAARVDRA